MLTNFTAAQLRDPQIAEANAILQTCVQYGFCTNTCPTYVLTRDENESPRGRIDLIRAMLERGGPPEPDTARHLDNCLSWLDALIINASGCGTTVKDYGHLFAREPGIARQSAEIAGLARDVSEFLWAIA